MKHGLKVSTTLLVAMLFSLSSMLPAYAQMVIFASSDYNSATVSLSSSGKATFSATTTTKCEEIKVTSCTLQIKSSGAWSDSKTLIAPSTIAKNTAAYAATKNYSSSMSGGNTYRIMATFNADGKTTTKYSNEITFN